MGNGSLKAVQRVVVDAAMRRSAVADDVGLLAEAERLVMPSHRGMSPAERLDVYREQFWLRHVPSLEEDYPTLCWALGGRSGFRELAVEYLAASPPTSWDLQRLGQGLPGHVCSREPWKRDPLAVGAARLDWAFMEAFDAPDAAPFEARSLSGIPEDAWPLATILLHPSVRMLTLTHPVHELRQAVGSGGNPERPTAARTQVVVWRDSAFCLQARAIEPEALALLTALAGGAPLGEACDALAKASGVADPSTLGARVSSWFQEWTASGWVRAVRFAG